MDKEKLKERYRRFRQWQETPFEYKLISEEQHHCSNCGYDYTGNFCPICSQKAGMGRIGWYSVRQGIMDIWGLGTRSLLYSVWQLLLRPGHIIADYIDGKRQVSFPPVKMLFILAVIYSMIVYWLLPRFFGIELGDYNSNSAKVFGQEIIDWCKSNYSWLALGFAVMSIFPTWVMFRYAPRHTRHTLPEGFFIQIFLAVIMVVLYLIIIPFGVFIPEYVVWIEIILYSVYYLIAYKQLFGYSFWGTLWRSGVIMGIIVFIASGMLLFVIDFDRIFLNNGIDAKKIPMGAKQFGYLLTMVSLGLGITIFIVGFAINLLCTRKARKQMKLERNLLKKN